MLTIRRRRLKNNKIQENKRGLRDVIFLISIVFFYLFDKKKSKFGDSIEIQLLILVGHCITA